MDITVNWTSVLIAGVVNFVVGWVWYGPLFGKTWKNLMGFTDESMKSMKMTPMQAMIGGFISSLVMVYILSHFVVTVGAIDIMSALSLAFWVWLGFVATVTSGMWLWEGKPFKLFALVAIEHWVGISLSAMVLTLWA